MRIIISLPLIKPRVIGRHLAGADTTTAPVQFAILNAILRPEIQRRAQAELDSVLGSPVSNNFRLPTFEDGPSLPYITALVKESLRWIPVQPISLPHASLEDDEFRGWRIPKGSVILPNVWTMLHDEGTYKDPFTFRPERFLTNIAHEAEPDPGEFGAFGFGRRYVIMSCSLIARSIQKLHHGSASVQATILQKRLYGWSLHAFSLLLILCQLRMKKGISLTFLMPLFLVKNLFCRHTLKKLPGRSNDPKLTLILVTRPLIHVPSLCVQK